MVFRVRSGSLILTFGIIWWIIFTVMYLSVVLDGNIHKHFPWFQLLRKCTRLEKVCVTHSLGRHRSSTTDIRGVYGIEKV
jgi:hypothetical protein